MSGYHQETSSQYFEKKWMIRVLIAAAQVFGFAHIVYFIEMREMLSMRVGRSDPTA